ALSRKQLAVDLLRERERQGRLDARLLRLLGGFPDQPSHGARESERALVAGGLGRGRIGRGDPQREGAVEAHMVLGGRIRRDRATGDAGDLLALRGGGGGLLRSERLGLDRAALLGADRLVAVVVGAPCLPLLLIGEALALNGLGLDTLP